MRIHSETSERFPVNLAFFDILISGKIWIKLPLVKFYWSFMQNVKRSTPNFIQSSPLEYSLVFANFNKSPRRKLLEWIMNSVFNNSNEICCCNKEQCFTPTLLSWSSLQLSTKSFVNSASETGKYYLRLPTTFCFWFRLFQVWSNFHRFLHTPRLHLIQLKLKLKWAKTNQPSCKKNDSAEEKRSRPRLT